MENSLNDELLCSLKDELREVTAQINVHSEKLMDLLVIGSGNNHQLFVITD